MRFLSVADRELRSAARQKATYRARWLTAVLFFGLLVWLLWVFDGFTNRRAAPEVFKVYSALTLLYCLCLGTARTADCISSERREGTLGLLFLTNLNSVEIIAGKLCSSALASVYALMAIFPMVALPLLMGGISVEYFVRTVLALLNGILFALAAGFLASVFCKRQYTAIALAMGLAIALGGGMFLGAAAADSYTSKSFLADWLASLSPIYPLLTADDTQLFGPSHYWFSTGVIAALSLSGLALATLVLARTWRDRPKRVRAWHRAGTWWRSLRSRSAGRLALRRRLLGVNPIFWLGARQQVSAPVIMVLAVILTLATVYVTAPFFVHVVGAGTSTPVVGYMLAWLWSGLAVHALVLYYAAMTASQRLAEDKQTGALELILSTPTTERTLSRGLWLAYARKMLFPALLAVLVTLFFVWMLLVLIILDPPGRMTVTATPGELFWSALLNRPLRGQQLDWQFGYILRFPLLVLLMMMFTWPTLGWVGRWLGLRMKQPGFAPMASLALLTAPPILLFSVACYLADQFDLDRLPEDRFIPLMTWLALAIGSGHCLVLSLWSASRLRHQLRPVAMSRYQPLPAWRWRLPRWRTVWRLAAGTATFAAVVALAVVSYYGYQNWHSKKSWRAFQAGLKQRGETLDISTLFPPRVPDGSNFARAPVFLGLLSATNRAPEVFAGISANAVQPNVTLMEWTRQEPTPLHPFLPIGSKQRIRANARARKLPQQRAPAATYARSRSASVSGGPDTNRVEDAAALLQGLEAQRRTMRELGDAAADRPAFQVSTNRDVRTAFRRRREQTLMESLHLVFQARACALLALGKNSDAAEDVLTGLRLARLARQLPDTGSSGRVQGLLMRSLQPLWEGLSQNAWTEPQLAAFQHELASFNLLADFTNAVRRTVLVHIEIWHRIPDSTNFASVLLPGEAGYVRQPAWQVQPRAWWFDSCIQLYEAGRHAIGRVDPGAGRIGEMVNWSDLHGLPLDSASQRLLQQNCSWGGNAESVAFAQTALNQAISACALERRRLAKGSYPETLDQLVPAFLSSIPHDAVSGRPVGYQPGAGGRYILRGVGPNRTDDRKRKGSDDWLWTYPTNAPSGKK